MTEEVDLLDSHEIQIEDAINELCPEESSLSNLPLLQILLRQRILECTQRTSLLRSELENTCDEDGIGIEAEGSTTAEARVTRIQEGIGALLTTLATIRSSSTESQSVVESITKEIRSLDLAKANIESAVVGLRRFGMLVNAFDQLARVAKGKRYREAASALQAVRQLSSHLHDLSTSVPRVAALFKAVQEIQGLLRRTIMDEFIAAKMDLLAIGLDRFEHKSMVLNKTQLIDSCLVVEALGDDAKNSLIEWYTTFQLREYRRIFSGQLSEAGQLDNITRRYAWFKRLLKNHEDDLNGGGGAKIFPESWQVGVSLCGQFGEVTREDLKSVLARSRSSLTVELLLDALQTTTSFEREMSQKFGMPYETIASRSKSTQVGSATPIRTAFESYLGIFVDAQDHALSEMFVRFRASKPKPSDFINSTDQETSTSLIQSSTELFHFYRQTLDRCASLSNRTPFLELYKVYQKWLRVYSEEILTVHSLNSQDLGRTSVEFNRISMDVNRLVNVPNLLCTCLVLNTAEYCAETSGQLQIRLKDNIDVEFKESVSLESEQDLFRGNISMAISSLLKELERACETGFTSMLRSTWKELEFVSSESPYTNELVSAITLVVNIVKQHLEQKKYVRSFCDKVVGNLILKFTQTIVKCRPIPMIAAEQIILDLQVIKSCLLTLPQIDPEVPIPMAYTKNVLKSVGRLDRLLKVILINEEPAEEFVKNYLLLIPCQSFSDFQKVLDLKGVKRHEQNNLLDVFLSKTSLQSDLDDTSFISSLDMNPEMMSTISSTNLLQFSGLSRETSRSSTPNKSSQSNPLIHSSSVGLSPESNLESHGGSKALSDFRRFGQKLGMGLRFSRETKHNDGN
ncbi:GARP complex subunit Vps53 [Melampsora larici-populina 98AG31]|uniref:GARP complex subunit Vps53 n=1 Tax=Melampsora larici-populina (strain 98AG31 / pathotype 3-4-7) TaxID=747676 RepID=F4R388_MELLP|nr:GARP complex subunit Vps53 [Melampsora larici-populina 98AG31]EGG13211.1 GARP complex subunit Vps53 [Melampsora larici-populina 98AG31]